MTYNPNAYLDYASLTAFLEDLQSRYPHRVRVESAGRSPEGREIWVATVGTFDGADPDQKPGYWVDGNTHATELMSSAACVHTLFRLTDGADEQTEALLQDATFYVAPRISPDGAEYVLKQNPHVRSAPRYWPDPRPQPGLIEQDLDGDGWVLQMRIPAEDGAWHVSEKDPRLMLARKPWDEGPFYHLYAEGVFEEHALDDPRMPMTDRNANGLDFNRNYPYHWRPEGQQLGSGPYPLSEPETRAIVDYLLAHPNIGGMTTYHTYSGVLLRPFSDRPDTEMPKFDRHTFDVFGQRCEELTSFPCLSTFHGFRYDDTDITTGVFDDWAYESFGVHCYTMELWCPWKHAGLDFSHDYLAFWRERNEDHELALLNWNDTKLKGACFEDWRAFEHPQLGSVEIGGWRWLYAFRNCPEELLESEISPSVEFTLDHARGLPKPRLVLECEAHGELTQVTAILRNDGFLPTYITEMALKQAAVKPAYLDADLSDGLTLKNGLLHQRPDHLGGQANHTFQTLSSTTFKGRTKGHVLQVTWWVRGSGTFTVTWSGDRIGRLESSIEI